MFTSFSRVEDLLSNCKGHNLELMVLIVLHRRQMKTLHPRVLQKCNGMKISFRCFNRKFLQVGYVNDDRLLMTSLLIKTFVQCHCLDCHTVGAIIGTINVNCSVL